MRPEFAALANVKYPEHILALHKANFAQSIVLEEGMNAQIPFTEFLAVAQPNLIIAQRGWLETIADFHQLLPYCIYVVVSEDPNIPDRIVLYRRSKVVGEEQLLGNYSIGFGGHPEFFDRHVHTTEGRNLIDLRYTINGARNRERIEEVSIRLQDEAPVSNLNDVFLGLINDNSDEVGTKHLGIATIAVLPEGTAFESNEPNQIMQGQFAINELLESDFKFESWTNICLQHLRQFFDDKGKLIGLVNVDQHTGDRSLVV